MTPIVFLSGFACQPWIWDPIIAQLECPCQAIAWPTGDSLGALTQQVTPLISPGSVVVGHSMGGLVGLELLRTGHISHLVLVECFLTPPPPFFRNLLLEQSPWTERVKAMLDVERRRYPDTLAASLKASDNLATARECRENLHALYGDRGCGDPFLVQRMLEWPEDFAIPTRVIPQACHFPMLENPERCATVLADLIGSLIHKIK